MNVELHNKILKSSAIGHMVSSIEYPAVILNSNHRIVLTNKAFRSLTGYTDEDILGLPPRILTHNNYSETDRQALRHSLSVLKKPTKVDFTICDKNKKLSKVVLFGAPLTPIHNIPAGYILLFNNKEEEMNLYANFLSIGISNLLNYKKPDKTLSANISGRGDKQIEIMKLAKLGYTVKESAVILRLSKNTIYYVKWKMGKKLSMPN
jgi:PAS domain S-box-containing protein